jgi:isopenicillin-N N-acyltransferase-like protein
MTTDPAATRSLPEVTVTGDPLALGAGYGEALRDAVRAVYDWRAGEIRTATGETEAALLARASAYLPAIAAFAPDLVTEIEGVGRGSGLGFERALALQVATELALEPAAGCSAIGRVGPDVEPFVAQNWDQPLESAGKQAIVRFEPAGKPRILMFGHAGVVGYIGLNDRGVGHAGNQLYASAAAPGSRGGLTQYAINRRLLEFDTAAAALEWLLSVPVASTCNYVLGDAAGTLVDAELGAGRAAVQARATAVAHTNHYLRREWAPADTSGAVLPDSPARLATLRSRAIALDALRDHTGHPAGVCRHEDPPGLTTRASIVLRLGEPALDVAPGPPCVTPYTTYRF